MLCQYLQGIFSGIDKAASGKGLHEVTEDFADGFFCDMDIAAVSTIDKGIGGINVQSGFWMHIDCQIVRQLQAVRAYEDALDTAFVDFIVEIAQHLADILRIKWRNILWWQISHGAGVDQILQSFFGKNGLIGTGDLAQNRKVMFDEIEHFSVGHRIVVHIFLDDRRCDIASGAGLGHQYLQRIRRSIGNIFL